MKRTLSAIACVIGLSVAATAWSEEATPADLATYRHVLMESMAKHMKASGMIVKGKVDRKQDLAGHAKALKEMGDGLGELYPEGTAPADLPEGGTDARPEIWSDREGFDAAVEQYQEAAAKYVEATEGTDFEAMKKAFGAVGKSCGDCHDKYRVEEEDH